MSELQKYSLLNTNIDIKGKAYEEIVGANLRGDRGEFFTPRNVMKMVVEMINPQIDEKVLDSSCGTGGFKVPGYLSILRDLKPVVDGLQKIKFDKAKAKYKAEHEKELKQYYAARRKVLEIFPDGKYDSRLLEKEYTALERAHEETYAKFTAIRDEYRRIWDIQSCVERGLGNTEQPHQKKDHRKHEER